MRKRQAALRQSVSIPPRVAKQVRAIAEANKTSASRVIVDLLETGPEARSFALANRLTDSDGRAERQKELARMTFGA